MKIAQLLLLLIILGCSSTDKESTMDSVDLAILNGRVMDPASGLDSVLNIGISDGKIVALSPDILRADRVIDAEGLVVTAGFIDLHQHGQTNEAYSYSVRDGVTSSFELEVGTSDVNGWYEERSGGQYVNYGVSIGHIPVRMQVMDDPGTFLPSGPANHDSATAAQLKQIRTRIQSGLDQGAVGVGFGLAYTPGASNDEFETILEIVKRNEATAFIHIRSLEEVIDGARNTGASIHVVHANSSGSANMLGFLENIQTARASGLDITTESYPYNASNTRIESALFDDWESKPDEYFSKLQWPETGEFLTRATFVSYRAEGGSVIMHMRAQEKTDTAILHPLTMIASDGMINNGKGHPRGQGSYARILGKYVREMKAFPLMAALNKMNAMPALLLEEYVPSMARKGRIAIGMDADITIFDPESVIDKATYTDPALPSQGISFVVVGGQLVVEDGQLNESVKPGLAVRNIAQ